MPTISEDGSKVRLYKCKNCAKTVKVPHKDWQKLPQKYKRWCPECVEHLKVMEQDRRERAEYMPYGPYHFGRFGF